jgi:transposase-like protein
MGRKKYTEYFKKKIGEAAAKGDKTFKQLSEEFGVHTTLVSNWKKSFMSGKFENLKKGQRKYTEDFKKQVGEAAAKGDKTLKLLSEEFGVHTTLVSNWKKDFLSGKFENKKNESATSKFGGEYNTNSEDKGEFSSILKKLCDRLGYDKRYQEKHGSELNYYPPQIKKMVEEFYYDEEDDGLIADLEVLCSELEDSISKADLSNIGKLAIEEGIFEQLELYPETSALEKALKLAGNWKETIEIFNKISKNVDQDSEKSVQDYVDNVIGLMCVGLEHAITSGDEDGVYTWVCGVCGNERYPDGELSSFGFGIDYNGDIIQVPAMDLLEYSYKIDFDDEDLRHFEDQTMNWGAVANMIVEANF